DTHISI
ncbi:hypothetical protein HID58_037957, partial [Brassica napus]